MNLRSRLLLAFLILPASVATAQWHSDSTTNTPVCTATNLQSNPRICSDGANGAIIVWEDLRSGSNSDIYAQRLDADGKPMWTANGVAVCTYAGDQKVPLIASDGSGGAYVVWEDSRTLTNGIDLYGQHINADGTLSYATSGAAVCVTTRDQRVANLASDEAGNAYVAWEDKRSSTTSTQPDIYANRLTPTGVSWTSTGMAICTQSAQQHRPRVCADGSGGCYIAWENNATVPTSIYAIRLNSSGTKLWTSTNGILVYKGANSIPIAAASRNLDIRRDGNQAMIAWEVANPSSSNGQDILANRVNSDSTLGWFSPAEVTGEWYNTQTNPLVFSDDSSGTAPNKGLMVIFNDYQDNISPNYYAEDLMMVRVLPDGVNRIPSYSSGFFTICRKTRGQVGQKVVKVEDGKLLAVWNDARLSESDTSIYAQCFDRTLTRYFPTVGTTSNWGKAISVSPNYLSKQVTLAPRTNGAIAAWADNRNGNFDIYAQLIFKDGSLPIELAAFQVDCHRAGQVDLFWKTATEASNAGFEVQRRTIADGADNGFTVVGSYVDDPFLAGAGTTSSGKSYAFVDRNVAPGIYEYRLIDIALDGSRTPHEPKRVDTRTIAVTTWAVGVARPNPSVSRFELPLSLPTSAAVTVAVYDVTGREVGRPVQHQIISAGNHSVTIDLSQLGLSSGSYALRVSAEDISTGSVIWQAAQSSMIEVMR